MNFLKKIDTTLDKVISKGGQIFLEYLIKYLMACGIGFNLMLAYLIFGT